MEQNAETQMDGETETAMKEIDRAYTEALMQLAAQMARMNTTLERIVRLMEEKSVPVNHVQEDASRYPKVLEDVWKSIGVPR